MAVSSGRGSRGAAIRLGVDTSQVSPALRGVANTLRNFSTTARGDLSKATAGFTGMRAAAVVAGTAIAGTALAVNVLRQAVEAADNAYKRFAETATSTRRVVALTGPLSETAVTAQAKRESSRSLSSGLTRNEVSGAYYQAISAGARGEKADKLIDTAIQMSIASGVPLDTAAQYLQVQENIFGTPSAQVGDITRAVEEAAITTVPELVQQQGYFLPQAKALGLGLEGGLAGYGAATLGGLGAQSGTATGALYRDLLNPTTKLAVAVERELGAGVKELIEQGKNVAEIMTELKEAAGESEFEALLTGETSKLGLFLATPEGVSAWDTVARNILDSDGKLQEAADFIEKSPEFIMKKFRASWDNFIIEAGALFAPAFNDLYTEMTDIIGQWTVDPQWQRNLESLGDSIRDMGLLALDIAEVGLPLLIGGLDTFIDTIYDLYNSVARIVPTMDEIVRPTDTTRDIVSIINEVVDKPVEDIYQRRINVALDQGLQPDRSIRTGDVPMSITNTWGKDYAQYGESIEFAEWKHAVEDLPARMEGSTLTGLADELNPLLEKMFSQVPLEWIGEWISGRGFTPEQIEELFADQLDPIQLKQLMSYAEPRFPEQEGLVEKLQKVQEYLAGIETWSKETAGHTDPENPANCPPNGASGSGSNYGTIDVLKVR